MKCFDPRLKYTQRYWKSFRFRSLELRNVQFSVFLMCSERICFTKGIQEESLEKLPIFFNIFMLYRVFIKKRTHDEWNPFFLVPFQFRLHITWNWISRVLSETNFQTVFSYSFCVYSRYVSEFHEYYMCVRI